MYNVSLVNLAADGRSAVNSLASIERPGLTDAELRSLLRSFCEVDPVENAVAEPEIRVKVRNENYLIRTGEKRLMLYDVAHRELPALVLTLDEIMAELDGSALAAREASALLPQEEPAVQVPASRPVQTASKPRLIGMGAVALMLFGAIIVLQLGQRKKEAITLFRPVEAAEAAGLRSALEGVYLTGNQPGQHGIVILETGEMKLFELMAVSAPQIIYVSGDLVRAGSQLALATDQPGGLIKVIDHDTLVYCGEVYRRIP